MRWVRWLFYLILVLIGFGVFDYFFLPKLTDRLNVKDMWNASNKRTDASMPQEQGASREILDLRQRHQLRPLTNAESGTRTRDLAVGIYGFATCDAQTLTAARTKDPVLEIHKHRDGIAYYVAYASEEQIEKYLTRQKNFHILASPEPREKASVLLEIPVDFVSTCAVRAGANGVLFDLFVTAIPELNTFYRGLDIA